MSLGRNDACHCGSGKKYKQCCQGKPGDIAAKGADAPGMSNGKMLLLSLSIIVVISGALWIAGFARLAQAFGAAMILIVVLGIAFRRPPTRRETPGDASGINFGN